MHNSSNSHAHSKQTCITQAKLMLFCVLLSFDFLVFNVEIVLISDGKTVEVPADTQ